MNWRITLIFIDIIDIDDAIADHTWKFIFN